MNETQRFLEAVQRGKADDVSKFLDEDPRLSTALTPADLARERGNEKVAALL